MAYILCIETVTDICSVAICRDNEVIGQLTDSEGMRHSSMLTSLIDQLSKTTEVPLNELEAIAISDGPGSYTGLRVGASTAKGIAMPLDIPIIAIPSLMSLAYPHVVDSDTIVMATIDARRMEAYGAIYKGHREVESVTSWIWDEDTAKSLSEKYDQIIIAGNGIEKGASFFQQYENVSIRPTICFS